MALRKRCKHPRDRWSRCGCAWWWDGYVDGRRIYRNVGADRAEARRLAAEIEADRHNDRARPIPRDRTLAAVAERWLDHLAEHGRRRQTLLAYRTAANAVERYFGPTRDVRLIDEDEVMRFEAAAFASRRGHGPALLMQALRGILNHAHRERIIRAVPRPPASRRTITTSPDVRMSLAETEATIAALRPEHWRDLAEVIVLTGLRIGEALALRWEDVDPAACRIRVAHSAEQRGRTDGPTKTPKSTRSLRVEPAVIDLILAQPRTQERVFPRRYAAALSAIRRAMKRAGTYRRDRGWHSLRHTNTALRNEAGQSIRDAAAALGHGAHFAQSMAYGWHAENREAPALSDLRQREAPSGRKPRRPT